MTELLEFYQIGLRPPWSNLKDPAGCSYRRVELTLREFAFPLQVRLKVTQDHFRGRLNGFQYTVVSSLRHRQIATPVIALDAPGSALNGGAYSKVSLSKG